MRKVKFLLDTLADLPPALVAGRSDISVLDIPIVTTKKDKTISFSNLNADSFAEVDELVQQGWVSKTSMPPIYESDDEVKYGILSVERATLAAIADGYDVLYLAVNSKISGAFQAISALFANINEEQNELRALCVDTECASTGLAMLFGDLLAYYDKSKTQPGLRDLSHYIEKNRSGIGMVFSWFEFTYIKNSGKVAALPAALGKIFGLHPIGSVEYSPEGGRPLVSLDEKIRGSRRFYSVLVRFIEATIADASSIITVAHGNCFEKIQPIVEALQFHLPKATILYGPEWRCGAAIQAHGGPTSIHINYHRKTPNCLAESNAILTGIAIRR